MSTKVPTTTFSIFKRKGQRKHVFITSPLNQNESFFDFRILRSKSGPINTDLCYIAKLSNWVFREDVITLIFEDANASFNILSGFHRSHCIVYGSLLDFSEYFYIFDMSICSGESSSQSGYLFYVLICDIEWHMDS